MPRPPKINPCEQKTMAKLSGNWAPEVHLEQGRSLRARRGCQCACPYTGVNDQKSWSYVQLEGQLQRFSKEEKVSPQGLIVTPCKETYRFKTSVGTKQHRSRHWGSGAVSFHGCQELEAGLRETRKIIVGWEAELYEGQDLGLALDGDYGSEGGPGDDTPTTFDYAQICPVYDSTEGEKRIVRDENGEIVEYSDGYHKDYERIVLDDAKPIPRWTKLFREGWLQMGLTPNEMRAVTACYLEYRNRTQAEIAKQFRIKESSLKDRLSAGRRKIKAFVEKQVAEGEIEFREIASPLPLPKRRKWVKPGPEVQHWGFYRNRSASLVHRLYRIDPVTMEKTRIHRRGDKPIGTPMPGLEEKLRLYDLVGDDGGSSFYAPAEEHREVFLPGLRVELDEGVEEFSPTLDE